MIGRRRRNTIREESGSYSCGLNSRKSLGETQDEKKIDKQKCNGEEILDLNRVLNKSIRRPNGADSIPRILVFHEAGQG
jgi:hypothetical protein